MQLTLPNYRIDPTPRRADGEYMAHARISAHTADGSEADIFMSGDLAGFDLRDDAVRYATKWAMEWIERRYGWPHRTGVRFRGATLRGPRWTTYLSQSQAS